MTRPGPHVSARAAEGPVDARTLPGIGVLASLHLGMDLGATNLKWAVVARSRGRWRQIDRGQEPTRGSRGPDAVVRQLVEVAAVSGSRYPGLASVGIGVPGLYDPRTGRTRFLPNMPGNWAGHPVAEPVNAAVGVPTALINDARAFGLAELRLGAARGARSMIGLTLGTGVGGAIALDGRIYLGTDGTGGELGHQTLEPDGLPCTCGNRGCLEAYARSDRITSLCGTASVQEAVAKASRGDRRALDGLAEVGRFVGIGIANMIVALTPQCVVIGGGVSGAGDLILEPIRRELVNRVRVTSLEGVRVVVAELGTWAGAIGAAIYGAEHAEPPRRTRRQSSLEAAR